MSIVDKVDRIADSNNVFSSRFFNEYQSLLSTYNTLIEKGIINKRQSQLCSISDKLQLITWNCNYYKTERR